MIRVAMGTGAAEACRRVGARRRRLLSAREREVLALLADGLSTKEAAKQLFLSPRTVDNHAHRMMKKLGFHSRVELARFAVREGIVSV